MNRVHNVAVLLACSLTAGLGACADGRPRPFVPVTDAMLQNPDPANWLNWRRTLDGWGYSPLDQISRDNVAQLKIVWTRSLGSMGDVEPTPLVYDGIMYLPSPGDLIQAIDAQAGDLLWEHQRTLLNPDYRATKRNIAIYGTTIISTSSDNHVFALDARTGTPVWETRILDATKPTEATSGPIIANGKIIAGRQCPVVATYEGCIITAHDAKTGKELWAHTDDSRTGGTW